ncbi:MAG: TlyA family RNA methyltransferase [Ruminococcaceae bacterium]|nr:TlyA family RNA methyltransferase [Oscillospiraceae bacterium]
MRADTYLSQNGYAESRTRAARLISEGKVLLDGKTVQKASEEICEGEHTVVITENDLFVGRGGLKLSAALEQFKIDVAGKKCIDVGASTGGFTDCLLQNGAAFVYAIDSGRGQLHPKLLSDERVVNIEGYNARALSRDELGVFDVAVMDVSFISQTLIHPALSDVLCDGAVFISLIKPQFESGRSALGKNGIVKDAKDREGAIKKVLQSAIMNHFEPIGIINSPIEGGDGNREYLACFVKREGTLAVNSIDPKHIIAISRN